MKTPFTRLEKSRIPAPSRQVSTSPSDPRAEAGRAGSWLFPFRVKTFMLYVICDILCIGLGMGVPIFCIVLGFPVGWYVGRRVQRATSDIALAPLHILRAAGATAAVTLLGMCLIWGRTVVLLFDPASDLANFGIPLILYTPRASFIGWLVLMVFISPFLQVLTTVFGAHVASTKWNNG